MTTETAATIGADKNTLLALLYTFINKRPGLEFGNYGNHYAYRNDIRSITRDRADALKLLRAVELRDSISAADIMAAFNGRLTLGRAKGKLCLDYCTGQYWPTEYRAAVARLASRVLWGYWRDCAAGASDIGVDWAGVPNVADYIRKTAKQELGRGIASRWFN